MAEKKAKAPAKDAPAPKAERASRVKTKPPQAAGVANGAEAGRTLNVVDASNQTVRQVTLSSAVFGVRVNEHLIYEAVKQYRAGARRGTHMTKNRGLVSGSGRKPWRQKGTGRARVGETRNPLWRHGGTVFGPQPRDYSYRMPKKAFLAALRSALAQRAAEGAVRVVDTFPIEAPKTKALRAILDCLGIEGKTVLVDSQPSEALVLSGRNIPGFKVVDQSHLSVYDVLDCRHLLLSQRALGQLEERLTP